MVQMHQHIENIKTWRTFVFVLINYKLTTKRVPWLWLVIPWYVVVIWFHRGEFHRGYANTQRATVEIFRRYLRNVLSLHA